MDGCLEQVIKTESGSELWSAGQDLNGDNRYIGHDCHPASVGIEMSPINTIIQNFDVLKCVMKLSVLGK